MTVDTVTIDPAQVGPHIDAIRAAIGEPGVIQTWETVIRDPLKRLRLSNEQHLALAVIYLGSILTSAPGDAERHIALAAVNALALDLASFMGRGATEQPAA